MKNPIDRPNKELFLPLKCKKKVCYIGSYLFVSDTKYISKSSRNELKILSLKRSDDIAKKAVEIFHIPSESEIEISEEKNKI